MIVWTWRWLLLNAFYILWLPHTKRLNDKLFYSRYWFCWYNSETWADEEKWKPILYYESLAIENNKICTPFTIYTKALLRGSQWGNAILWIKLYDGGYHLLTQFLPWLYVQLSWCYRSYINRTDFAEEEYKTGMSRQSDEVCNPWQIKLFQYPFG